MIYMSDQFKTPANRRPLAKAVHQFSASSLSKWVPINKSFQTLTQIILRATVERLGLANLAVTLRCVNHQGYRHLVLVSHDDSLQLAAVGRVEEFIISTEAAMPMSPVCERLDVAEAVTVSINYRQQRLGYLHAMPRSDVSTDIVQLSDSLGAVIDELLGVIQRYQTRHRAIYIYGDQAYWVGHSEALRLLDQRINKLAQAAAPVVIRGDKGTGKVIAARSLHCARHSDMVAFIESSCNEWEEGAALSVMNALYSYARGGSLYLRNVDRLSPASLKVVREFWDKDHRDCMYMGAARQVDLLLSLSQRNGVVSRELGDWIARDCAELYLPSLTERLPDLRDLVHFFWREHAQDTKLDFTEDAWRMLEALEWQNNVEQLRQLIQRLALVADKGTINESLLFSVISA